MVEFRQARRRDLQIGAEVQITYARKNDGNGEAIEAHTTIHAVAKPPRVLVSFSGLFSGSYHMRSTTAECIIHSNAMQDTSSVPPTKRLKDLEHVLADASSLEKVCCFLGCCSGRLQYFLPAVICIIFIWVA